jgi:hypothetical protein
MYPLLVSAHLHGRHRDINVIFMHKATIETMSDGLQIIGRWPPEPPNNTQMPFAASVVTEAVDLIDGPTKQPRWTNHKRGR